jgi:hypothetical protein
MALLPAKTIAASVKGLNQHARIFKHEVKWAWHRVEAGRYVLIAEDGARLGTVEFTNDSWYAAVNADVIGTKPNDGPFVLKKHAQEEVERLATRIVRVVMS